MELDADGNFVRGSDAADPADPELRPYSLLVLPEIDRVVTTATDMRGQFNSASIQTWRLTDLSLIKTISLPPGERGDENFLTAEPRLLADGTSIIVNTFNCGMYALEGVEGTEPSAHHVMTFPFERGQECALPVLIGKYWVQTVPASESLVSLDMSDPRDPQVVQELKLGENYRPHWISEDPAGERIAVTGEGAMLHRALIVRFDRATGTMEVDGEFRSEGSDSPGGQFDREEWPHEASGPAVPHGAIFSR